MNVQKIKSITYLALIVACLCMMRAFAVHAAPSNSRDIDEVYEASSEASDDDDDDDDSHRSSIHKGERADIRLSRPEEAAARQVREADDPAYAMVEGAERLRTLPANTIAVPVARAVASADKASPMAAPDLPDLMVPMRKQQAARAPASPRLEPQRLEPHRLEPMSPIPVREDRGEHLRASLSVGTTESADYVIASGRTISAERLQGLQEISVIASDQGFFPSRIFVTQGIPVKIYLSTPSKNALCFMSDGLGVKKGILPGQVEEVSFVPENAGDFRIYCPMKSLEGKITVRAPASASVAAPVSVSKSN